MFGPKMHVTEAPLLGAAVGGLMAGGGATLASWGTGAVLGGMALGAVGGTLLGKMMKTPKVKSAQSQESNAAKETPALPPAAAMPAAPMTPAASPQALNTTDAISPDISKADRPQVPADAAPPTTEEIARGQLEKKRKGRLSTILTSPKSRLEAGGLEDEGFERLGG